MNPMKLLLGTCLIIVSPLFRGNVTPKQFQQPTTYISSSYKPNDVESIEGTCKVKRPKRPITHVTTIGMVPSKKTELISVNEKAVMKDEKSSLTREQKIILGAIGADVVFWNTLGLRVPILHVYHHYRSMMLGVQNNYRLEPALFNSDSDSVSSSTDSSSSSSSSSSSTPRNGSRRGSNASTLGDPVFTGEDLLNSDIRLPRYPLVSYRLNDF